jgi:hypothetical protein
VVEVERQEGDKHDEAVDAEEAGHIEPNLREARALDNRAEQNPPHLTNFKKYRMLSSLVF